MNKKIFLPLALIFLCNTQAYAERACCAPKPKWYAGISGGASFLSDSDIEESASGLSSSAAFDTGFTVAGQLGYRVMPYVRLELEAGYRKNDMGSVDSVPYTTGSPNIVSQAQTLSAMANGYFDFPLHSEIIPYLGAGIGIAKTRIPIIFEYIPTGESHKLDDWVMAYQFMTGANFPVPDSGLSLSLGYRYFTTQDGEVEFTSVPGGATFSFSNASHNIELGLQVNF